VTENDAPHSGSRWEPHPWDGVHPPSDPASALPSAGTATTEGTATGRRTGWARRGVLAGAGAGILVIGGVGGFAAGHAFAGTGGSSPAVVQGGIPGQNGTGGMPEFGDGDGNGPRDGFHDHVDGVPPGGGAPAAPPAGTGDGTAGGDA
jgi:hypothetical protein